VVRSSTIRSFATSNLRDAKLREANLSRSDFSGADLTGADVTDADLRGAKLGGATWVDGCRLLPKGQCRQSRLSTLDLTEVDLTQSDLHGAQLQHALLAGAVLVRADLGEANLAEADLRGARLSSAVLRGADLGKTRLSGVDLQNADLSGARLAGADLGEADLRGAVLAGAEVAGADFRDAKLEGATWLDGCTFVARGHCAGIAVTGAIFPGASLAAIDFKGAKLAQLHVGEADLHGADLSDADLGEAYMRGANLRQAKLAGADLASAVLIEADLSNADFTGASLLYADLAQANLAGANFRRRRSARRYLDGWAQMPRRDTRPVRLTSLHRRRALAVLALILAGVSSAVAEDKKATFAAINPPAVVKNLKIEVTGLTLDGAPLGRCDDVRRLKNGVCLKPQPIGPGPHVVEVTLEPFSSTYFRGVFKFTAGVRGDFVLDLAKFAMSDQQDEYLQLHGSLAPVEGCIPTVERIASLSSCGSDGLDEVSQAFLDAARACGNGKADHDALERALAQALAVHFKLDIHRCYDAASLERLPGVITASKLPDDGGPWPPGSIANASWYWARDVLAEDTPGHDPVDVFDAVLQALPRLAERQAMVDSVIAAYLNRDPKGVLKEAEALPWSHDPDQTAGHRHLLVLMDPDFFYDATYADDIAAKIVNDTSLDCSTTAWEAEHLLRFFTARDTVSRAEWQAVAAMMARTPPNGDFTNCQGAFDARRRSPVSVSERLHYLVTLDCAPERRVRGVWLKQIVRKDSERMPLVDFDLRDQLRTEFAGCLEGK